MGKIDVRTKEFWRDNNHFADLFNAVVFHGMEVIDPKELAEADTEVSAVVKTTRKYLTTVAKARDVVKKFTCGTEFVVMGIENQAKIDYTMPVRAMMYDALGYWRECRSLLDGSMQDETRSDRERLFSIEREDRLHPIITLIIYYGEEPWCGPRSLHDLLHPSSEEIRCLAADYPLNLIEVRDSDDLVFHDPEVEALFSLIRKMYRKTIDHTFKNVKRNIAGLVGAIVGSDQIVRLASRSRKEELNLCRALEEMIREGKIEGKIEAYLDVGLSTETIAEKLKLTEAEIKAVLAGAGSNRMVTP